MDQKTTMKINFISLLDQAYPRANEFFDSLALSDGSQKQRILSTSTGMRTVYAASLCSPLRNIPRNDTNATSIISVPQRRKKLSALF